jgi:hypothetical protein
VAAWVPKSSLQPQTCQVARVDEPATSPKLPCIVFWGAVLGSFVNRLLPPDFLCDIIFLVLIGICVCDWLQMIIPDMCFGLCKRKPLSSLSASEVSLNKPWGASAPFPEVKILHSWKCEKNPHCLYPSSGFQMVGHDPLGGCEINLVGWDQYLKKSVERAVSIAQQ